MLKIYFTQDSEIKFLHPQTRRPLWYGSDYGKGTSIEVSEVISGNSSGIIFRCIDGELGFVPTKAVRIEHTS